MPKISDAQRLVLEKIAKIDSDFELHFTLGQPRLYYREKWGWDKVAHNTFNSLVRRGLISLEKGYGTWHTITPLGLSAIGRDK